MRSKTMIKITIKRGREDSIRRFHPWVFSGAIDKMSAIPDEGEIVKLYSKDGEFLAMGHYQIGSITVRILSFQDENIDENGRLDDSFWDRRFESALNLRIDTGVINDNTNAYRLIHGEGDLLPGLIVDFYNGTAVLQAHSAGMFLSRESIKRALIKLYGEKLTAIYDKSSSTAPFKAGLDLNDGLLWGEGERGIISENGVRFAIDWVSGQKTGFFLDQRDNRELVRRFAKEKDVLNLFCYTGGFSLYALKGGARSVVSVDSSAKAIEMVEENLTINNLEETSIKRHTSVCDDAIEYINRIDEGRFDLMIVDPPAFAKHRGSLDNALRAYRRLNALAISKIRKGGIILTFSCSQVVDKNRFALTVFSAAAQTGRSVKILGRLTQPADHPVNIYHPEGEYLKGLILYVE